MQWLPEDAGGPDPTVCFPIPHPHRNRICPKAMVIVSIWRILALLGIQTYFHPHWTFRRALVHLKDRTSSQQQSGAVTGSQLPCKSCAHCNWPNWLHPTAPSEDTKGTGVKGGQPVCSDRRPATPSFIRDAHWKLGTLVSISAQ